MKLTKIFLFILLAFFVGNIYSASAEDVTGSVTVTVTITNYTLTIPASGGTGAGTYGGTTAGSIASGTNVSITATANATSNFTRWEATGSALACNNVTTSPCAFVMTADASVRAIYTLKPITNYTLTIPASGGTGAGTYGGTTAGTIASGTDVSITATANATSNFTRWETTGAALSCNNVTTTPATCDFKMTADASVRAIYTLKTITSVTVTANPLEYNVSQGTKTNVNFTYTSTTTSNAGTECRLVDYKYDVVAPTWKASSPISYLDKAWANPGDYGYYVQCRDKGVDVSNTSELIHVIVKALDVEYTVTVSANAGGTVSPLGATKVKAGNDLSITYSLDTGFAVQSIVVDGTKLGSYGPTIKITNVNKNQTVVFTFTEKVISVNVSASPASMILPDNKTTLKWETKGSPDSCTASGDWNGAVATTGGTKNITYTKFGTYIYTVTCKKVGKPDAKDSQKVEVRSIGVGLGVNGPSTITLPENTTLQWVTNGNPTSCTASGDWKGNKNPTSLVPHTETLKNLKVGVNTFDILCKKGTEEATSTVNLTVLADPNGKNMTGTLTASNCTLKVGEKTCSIPYSWEVFNPEIVGGSAVTIPPVGEQIAKGDKGSKTLNLAPGKTTLYLYNNGEPYLAKKEVEALVDINICTLNAQGVCEENPGEMTGTLNASNCTLEAGKGTCPIPYSWEVFNPEIVGGSAVTIPPVGEEIAKGDKGSKTLNLAPGKIKLFLYNNKREIVVKEVEAKIDTSICTWNAVTGICEENPIFVGEPSPVWSPWAPDSGVCLDIPKQTRYCYDENTNDKLDPGQCPIEDGLSNERITSYLICPAVTNMTVMNGSKSIRIGNSNLTTLIRYNSNVKVSWSSVNSTTCSCSYFDSTSSGGCGSETNDSFSASALKRDTTYTVVCKDKYGLEGSDSVTVKIDKINADYIEQ